MSLSKFSAFLVAVKATLMGRIKDDYEVNTTRKLTLATIRIKRATFECPEMGSVSGGSGVTWLSL